MRDPQSITVNEDERLIPVWSIVAAAVALSCWWSTTSGWCCRTASHPPPPLGFRIYFNLSWGLLAALYFLMVGYVSKDAPRRAMSSRFWIVICFVMPGGIGAVLYFLLRAAGGFALPGLLDACAERLPLLPAMRLPAHRQLRQLLPHGARHRPVLHALRP